MEKHRRRVACGAAPMTFSLIITLLLADFYWENITSINQWMRVQRDEEEELLMSPLARLVRGKDRRKLEGTGYACDVAGHSIVCVSDRAVRIDTHDIITIYTASNPATKQEEETIVKPFPLQKDQYLLQYIAPVKVLQGNKEPPVCRYNYQIPALVFSSGISRNLFHEFNDIIIPLFITIKHFQSQVLIIIEDYNPMFVSKYRKVISRLSSYDVMNPTANRSIHCFPSLVLGIRNHGNLALNPSEIPGGYSTRDFLHFLHEAYNLEFKHVSQIRKPTLMLISREQTRKFLNEDDIIAMLEGLGFTVLVATTKEASNLNKFANTVNSCAVLVGAHGAGLTNELFLPPGAVMVQVEPLGLEWASEQYYGNPARGMDLHYLRYKIEPEESSLVESYGRSHSVIMDPESVYSKGYGEVKAVYLEQQNIRVDIARFEKTMLQALQLIRMHH